MLKSSVIKRWQAAYKKIDIQVRVFIAFVALFAVVLALSLLVQSL
jgi:hypothetical protein